MDRCNAALNSDSEILTSRMRPDMEITLLCFPSIFGAYICGMYVCVYVCVLACVWVHVYMYGCMYVRQIDTRNHPQSFFHLTEFLSVKPSLITLVNLASHLALGTLLLGGWRATTHLLRTHVGSGDRNSGSPVCGTST